MAEDTIRELAKKKKKRKRRRCRVVKKTKTVNGKRKVVKVRKCRPKRKYPKPKPVYVAPPVPAPPAPPRLKVIQSPIAVYAGAFGPAQAERLAWRAGYGPRPGQVGALAALDLEAAVMSFTRPTGEAPMDGPAPLRNKAGESLDLATDEGAAMFWFDRMVRSQHQLVERLALVFHDWWATRRDGVADNREMLDQINLFRAHGLGSFREMTYALTTDAAMLRFLNGDRNHKSGINENYARELMELFTLGADRGAYTEDDVRQMAKALTGWETPRDNGVTVPRFNEFSRWDPTNKTIFGKTGRFNWKDACDLALGHPMHPSFFVRKLWSYFIATPPSDAESAALEQLYVNSGNQIRPVLEAILCHPAFYEGPRMVKPPIVFAAGMLRAQNRGITLDFETYHSTYEWHWNGDRMGQQLHYPPDVSGWNDNRWLDTNTTLGRWDYVRLALRGQLVAGDTAQKTYPLQSADEALAAARVFWGDPALTPETIGQLQAFAYGVQITGSAADQARKRARRYNALRQLIAASPDYQTC